MRHSSPLWLCALALAACTTPLPGPHDGGTSDLGAACSAAKDSASCKAISGCKIAGCPDCKGGLNFVACVGPDQSVGIECPAICPAADSCGSITDAAACDARPDCYALYSGDRPCDNASCSNHFVQCNPAPANCGSTTQPCAEDCTTLTPTCPAGLVSVFPTAGGSCCASGCATGLKCDPTGE